MLDVHGRHDMNAGLEEIEDVLVPLVVPAPRHVRVCELVDDTDLGRAFDDRLDVHLLHGRTSVVHLAPGHDLEILDLGLGIAPVVCLHESDDDVEAAVPERVGLLKHLVGLADTWRRADVDAQPCTLPLLDAREECVSSGPVFRHVPGSNSSADRARGSAGVNRVVGGRLLLDRILAHRARG